jgi:hypothetical protein
VCDIHGGPEHPSVVIGVDINNRKAKIHGQGARNQYEWQDERLFCKIELHKNPSEIVDR